MAVTASQKKATAKYEKENYDKILTRFPKGYKDRILGTNANSINSFIIQAVTEKLEKVENEISKQNHKHPEYSRLLLRILLMIEENSKKKF